MPFFSQGFLLWNLIVRKIICQYRYTRDNGQCFLRFVQSKCKQMYGMLPTTVIGKDFLLWLLAVSSNKVKMHILFMSILYKCNQLQGLLPHHLARIVLIFFSGFTHHNGKSFLYFASSITIGKEFLLWLFAQSPPVRQNGSHLKWDFQV